MPPPDINPSKRKSKQIFGTLEEEILLTGPPPFFSSKTTTTQTSGVTPGQEKDDDQVGDAFHDPFHPSGQSILNDDEVEESGDQPPPRPKEATKVTPKDRAGPVRGNTQQRRAFLDTLTNDLDIEEEIQILTTTIFTTLK